MARLIRSSGSFLATLVGVALAVGSRAASAQSGLVYRDPQGEHRAPALPGGLTYVKVATGYLHFVALRSDGSVLAWGDNSSGQCDVPALPPGLTYVDVAAGAGNTLARRSDGSLIAWGWNNYGQCNVPALPSGITYTQVAGGFAHSVAIRSDGSAVAWGSNAYGQCEVQALPTGLTYVEVAAGGYEDIGFTLARRSDGSLVAWGDDFYGQCAVPGGNSWVKIGAGAFHGIAMTTEGVVHAWGDDSYRQCQVPPSTKWLHYVDFVAGDIYNATRRNDGTTVAWGYNFWGEHYLPSLPHGLAFVEIEGNGVGRYAGCATCELPFCLGDSSQGSVTCPCGNSGSSGHGCENSATTGGAKLTVYGEVNLDRVVLSTTAELPTALSIFIQGRSVLGAPVTFGDGVRCIGGALKRIGVKTAVAGAASYPRSGDPSISARSAALGDLIRPGTYRYYQVCYRDPNPAFCNPATFNASNAVMVAW